MQKQNKLVKKKSKQSWGISYPKLPTLILATLLLSAFQLVLGQTDTFPYLVGPTSFSTEDLKITGLDSRPNYQDRITGVGIHTVSSNTYRIIVFDFDNWGKQRRMLQAFKLVPDISEYVEPQLFAGQDKYMVVWQTPSTKEIYAFDAGNNDSQDQNNRLAKVTPSLANLNDPFAFAYWDDYMGMISTKANRWFYASIELQNGNRAQKLEAEQPSPGTGSICSSCFIRGVENDDFLIGGLYSGNLELVVIRERDKRHEIDIRVPQSGTYANHYFSDGDATKQGGDEYQMSSIARSSSTTTFILGWYDVEVNPNQVHSGLAIQITLDNPMTKTKCRIAENGSNSAFYMFMTTGKPEVFVLDRDDNNKLYKYKTQFATSATGLVFTDFAALRIDKGFLFSGVVQSYTDGMGSAPTTIPSGASYSFVAGMEEYNSCNFYSSTSAKTQISYTNLGVANFYVNDNDNVNSITKTFTSQKVDYHTEFYRHIPALTEATDTCSEPLITYELVPDQYYIISDSSILHSITFNGPTYGPTSYFGTGLTFNSEFDMVYKVSDGIGTINSRSWGGCTDDYNTQITCNTNHINNALIGEWKIVLSSKVQGYNTAQTYEYSLWNIEFVTAAPSVMVYALNNPNIEQDRPSWSLNPSGGTLPTFTISYTLMADKSGTAGPSWLQLDLSQTPNKIVIDGADASLTTQYTEFFLRGCVDGQTPARCYHEGFMVLIFDIIASTPVSQFYIIGESQLDYTIPWFTITPNPYMYTRSYQLLVEADDSIATSTYSAWLTSFTSSNQKMTVLTSDAAQAGVYNLKVRGSVVGSPYTMVRDTGPAGSFQVTLIDFEEQVQDDLVYIVGDTTKTVDPINQFTLLPASLGYSVTYSLSQITGNSLGANLTLNQATKSIEIGIETRADRSGSHTLRLTGVLTGAPISKTKSIDFTMHIVLLAGSTTDLYYRIQTPVNFFSDTYPAITWSPTTNPPIPSYTFTYSIVDYTGSVEVGPSPSWISTTSASRIINISTALNLDAGHYDLAIKAVVDQSTTAVHYMPFQAHLYTYIAQQNDYQVYAIGFDGQFDYTILEPQLSGCTHVIPTCSLYHDNSLTSTSVLAGSSTPTSSFLSFNTGLKRIRVNTADTSLQGEYQFRYACQLSITNEIEESSFKYYLVDILPSPMQPMVYVNFAINQIQPIGPFVYLPATLPVTSYPVTYTLTKQAGPSFDPCQLIGQSYVEVLQYSSQNVQGTYQYRLTGTFSGTDSLGRPITTMSDSSDFNVHIVDIQGSVQDMSYIVGSSPTVQIVQPFSQMQIHYEIPIYTYTYELRDYTGGTLGGPFTNSVVTIDQTTSPLTITAYESNSANLGNFYDLAILATVNEVPSATYVVPFKVLFFEYYAPIPSLNYEYLIVSTPAGADLQANYPIVPFVVNPPTIPPAWSNQSYQVLQANGSSAPSWISINTLSSPYTISIQTGDRTNLGIFQFVLQGTLSDPSAAKATCQIKIYMIEGVVPGGVPDLVYFVGEPFLEVTPDYFQINPQLNNFPYHSFTNFAVQSYDITLGTFVNKVPFFVMPSLIENKFRIEAQSVESDSSQQLGSNLIRVSATLQENFQQIPYDPNQEILSQQITVDILKFEPTVPEDKIQVITYRANIYEISPFKVIPATTGSKYIQRGSNSLNITYELGPLIGLDNNDDFKVDLFAQIVDDKFLRIQTDDLELEGEYRLRLFGTIHNIAGYLALTRHADFNVTLQRPRRDFVPPLNHTYFYDLEDYRMNLTEGWTKTINLKQNGLVFGKYGDSMQIDVVLGRASPFARFNPETSQIEIDRSKLSREWCGDYEIQVIARFNNITYTEHYKQTFWLTIVDDDPYQGRDPIVVQDWLEAENIVRDSFELGEYSEEQPIPYIESLDQEGLLVLAWDRPIQILPFQERGKIKPTKVAILNKDLPREKREELNKKPIVFDRSKEKQRLLQDEHDSTKQGYYNDKNFRNLSQQTRQEMWFTNTTRKTEWEGSQSQYSKNMTKYLQWVTVVDALELNIISGIDNLVVEKTDVDFKWTLQNFTSERLWIQLDFEDARKVSEGQKQHDRLIVSFWGTKFFKTPKGVEVRYATTLSCFLPRQIDSSRGSMIRGFQRWIQLSIMIFFLTMSLLMWLFRANKASLYQMFDSFSLMIHLILLSPSILPANATYFFKDFIKITRLDFLDLGFQRQRDLYSSADSYFIGEEMRSRDLPPSSVYLQLLGYQYTFVGLNLTPLIVILSMLLLIWAILSFKDTCFVKRRESLISKKVELKRKDSSQGCCKVNSRIVWKYTKSAYLVSNLLIRILMCTLLEIFICLVLNIRELRQGAQPSSFAVPQTTNSKYLPTQRLGLNNKYFAVNELRTVGGENGESSDSNQSSHKQIEEIIVFGTPYFVALIFAALLFVLLAMKLTHECKKSCKGCCCRRHQLHTQSSNQNSEQEGSLTLINRFFPWLLNARFDNDLPWHQRFQVIAAQQENRHQTGTTMQQSEELFGQELQDQTSQASPNLDSEQERSEVQKVGSFVPRTIDDVILQRMYRENEKRLFEFNQKVQSDALKFYQNQQEIEGQQGLQQPQDNNDESDTMVNQIENRNIMNSKGQEHRAKNIIVEEDSLTDVAGSVEGQDFGRQNQIIKFDDSYYQRQRQSLSRNKDEFVADLDIMSEIKYRTDGLLIENPNDYLDYSLQIGQSALKTGQSTTTSNAQNHLTRYVQQETPYSNQGSQVRRRNKNQLLSQQQSQQHFEGGQQESDYQIQALQKHKSSNYPDMVEKSQVDYFESLNGKKSQKQLLAIKSQHMEDNEIKGRPLTETLQVSLRQKHAKKLDIDMQSGKLKIKILPQNQEDSYLETQLLAYDLLLAFIARRVLFAIAVVYFAEKYSLICLQYVMVTCIISIRQDFKEQIYNHPLLFQQSVVNEILLYLFALVQHVTPFVGLGEAQEQLGAILVCLFFFHLLYNCFIVWHFFSDAYHFWNIKWTSLFDRRIRQKMNGTTDLRRQTHKKACERLRKIRKRTRKQQRALQRKLIRERNESQIQQTESIIHGKASPFFLSETQLGLVNNDLKSTIYTDFPYGDNKTTAENLKSQKFIENDKSSSSLLNRSLLSNNTQQTKDDSFYKNSAKQTKKVLPERSKFRQEFNKGNQIEEDAQTPQNAQNPFIMHKISFKLKDPQDDIDFHLKYNQNPQDQEDSDVFSYISKQPDEEDKESDAFRSSSGQIVKESLQDGAHFWESKRKRGSRDQMFYRYNNTNQFKQSGRSNGIQVDLDGKQLDFDKNGSEKVWRGENK